MTKDEPPPLKDWKYLTVGIGKDSKVLIDSMTEEDRREFFLNWNGRIDRFYSMGIICSG